MRSRTGRLALALGIVFVLASIGAVIAALAQSGRRSAGAAGPEDAGTPMSRAFACIEIEPGHCGWVASDMGRRAPLTNAQATATITAGEDARWAVRERHRLFPGPQEPSAIEDTLRDAGYSDVIARAARPGDPAPPGSIVYAVATTTGCWLGYVDAQTDPGSGWVAGRLPSGGCLDP